MPIRYLQIQPQIKKFGEQSRLAMHTREQQLALAMQTLRQCGGDTNALSLRIQSILASGNRNLRFALPTHEPANGFFSAQAVQNHITVLAADGSQIEPDRHAALLFALINIGIFHLAPGSGSTPQESVLTTLLDFSEVNDNDHALDEDLLSLKRDLMERQELVKAAAKATGLVLALTDGPLELYHEPQQDQRMKEPFNLYLNSLRELASQGVIAAGYVDKPRADLVTRMLELVLIQDINRVGQERPLRGISDADLFSSLLAPHQRSALFGMHSSSSRYYHDELELHFFYLNVGREGHAWIARVEVPAWVVRDNEQVNLLQQVLLEQTCIMGSKPYPYALHRAHEIALVTYEEKRQLETQLLRELQTAGLPLQIQSHKSSAKQLARRKRNPR